MAKHNVQASSYAERTTWSFILPGKLPLLEYEVLHRDKGESAEDDVVQHQDPNYCGSDRNAAHFMPISVVIQERLRNLLRCHVHPRGNGENVLLVVSNLVHEVTLNERVGVHARYSATRGCLRWKSTIERDLPFPIRLGEDNRDAPDV